MQQGVLVADRIGPVTNYAMINLQDRSSMMVKAGDDVYEGMIIGENSRAGDMDVNICREKKQTNVRASSSDETVKVTPPKLLSLEGALEFISPDECVEVTPGRRSGSARSSSIPRSVLVPRRRSRTNSRPKPATDARGARRVGPRRVPV